MRLALAIASFVVLIVHGIVFYDQFFHRWERHQTAYFDQARGLSKNAGERVELEARRPRIEQFIVTSFGETRVDRCGTCHMASDDPRFQRYAEPLRTHPYSTGMGDVYRNGRWQRRHKFADFGCTVCHDGQGRGLENYYSHGEDPYWPEPLLGYVTQASWRKDFQPKLKGKEFLEANCAQCHTEENFAGTPHVARGRKLFVAMNCYGCHKIDGISDGTLGPDLTEVGKKFKVDYLYESIVEPRANLATSFMPKFRLSEDDVKSLVVFLKSRRGMNFAETGLDRYKAQLTANKPELPEQQKGETGEALIRDRACTACHKLGSTDGGIAPDLSYEGLLKDAVWIEDHFRNPRSRVPDSIMPAFRFPEGDFRAMAAYLAKLQKPPAPMPPDQTYRELCSRCHGEKGDGNGPTALYLDPAPRDLTKAAFMTNKPEDRFVNSIRNGVPGTSMPGWGRILGDEQARGVLRYAVATFTKEPLAPKMRNLPDQNPAADSPDAVAHGEKIFLQRCTGCHGRKADGKGPNSLDIVPRPRNLRNTTFVESVSDRRLLESILYGVQGTAMPPWIDYGLSQKDAGDVIRFIRSLNQKTRTQYASAGN